MKRLMPLAAAGALLTSLAACTPGATPTSPTIIATGPTASTVVCTPIGSTTATPCTQQQYDQLQQQLADYADAEKVYRQFADADARLFASGQIADEAIRAMLAGPMLIDYPTRREQLSSEGITAKGTFRLAYVRGAPIEKEGVDAELVSCLDASGLSIYKAGELVGPGKAARDTTYFKRIDGVMKLYDQTSEVLTAC